MKVILTYFKENGKYYSTGEYEAMNGLSIHTIFADVRMWKLNGKPLPGLIGSWNGPILIDVPDHEHRHPHLIPHES